MNQDFSNQPDDLMNNNPDEQGGKKHKGKSRAFLKLVAAGMAFGIVSGAAFQGYYAITNPITKSDSKNESSLSTNLAENNSKDPIVATTSSKNGVANDVSDVAAKVMPSIVAINSDVTATNYDFFGREYKQEGQSSGSGIIIGQNDNTLYIVTNNHVIDGATKVQIKFVDDKTATASVKGADSNADLAILTVDMNSLSKGTADTIKVANLGNSDDVKAGELAIAIGNALGYGQSVTVGYISAVNREVTINNQTMKLLQTDAAINPGNSGGALLNAAGEVIGINSVKYASEEVEGMGYAIPISSAIPMINELMNREVVSERNQGFLGINASTAQEVTSLYSERFHMPIGVYVNDIVKKSPAEKAGLVQGDIITGIDNVKIETIDNLINTLSYKKSGQEIKLIIQKKENGKYVEKTLNITLGKKN